VRLRVGLIGDHDPSVVAHRAIPAALELAAEATGLGVAADWVGTEAIDPAHPDLAAFDGLWCVPNSPYRSTLGAISGIRFARVGLVPFLGTCGGFQHAVLECAGSLWGLGDAAHAELDPGASRAVITPLACALVEVAGTVHFARGSRLARAYGRLAAEEEYHCSYGLNPLFRSRLDEGPLRATAWDDAGDVRGVELDDHPFFVATLFQPERAGLRGASPPVVRAFVAAAAERRLVRGG